MFERFMTSFARDPLANGIAVATLIGMILSMIAAIWMVGDGDAQKRSPWPKWLIPAVCILGLGVAGYLTYVESTAAKAVCGPIGDCNAVQASPYARLFGLIPVGVMGLAGYAAILLAWLARRYAPPRWTNACNLAMWGMAVFGVLFSIYLTFLEPFVIGATCAWCITSALLITLLLWVTTPEAAAALADE